MYCGDHVVQREKLQHDANFHIQLPLIEHAASFGHHLLSVFVSHRKRGCQECAKQKKKGGKKLGRGEKKIFLEKREKRGKNFFISHFSISRADFQCYELQPRYLLHHSRNCIIIAAGVTVAGRLASCAYTCGNR